MNQGQPEKIRLTGIDTPEKAQAFGGKAKVFTADLVGLQRVRVEFKERDRYGRILGEVFLEDGRSLNREILKAGLAWWYRQYSKDQSLGILETEAKNAGRGLWADPHPVPPWEWRRGTREDKHDDPPKVAAGFFHGNTKSRVFHKPGCRYYDCQSFTASFNSRWEATGSGYNACKVCKP